jgi:4,5-dihydroxyphthalate decarboxylase
MLLARDHEMLRPILRCDVPIEGVDLQWTDPDDERLLRSPAAEDFGVVEMSLADYLRQREAGSAGWLLPSFVNRRFPHAQLVVPEGSGIASPADLAGKRVAADSPTGALWTRAALTTDFAAPPATVEVMDDRSAEDALASGVDAAIAADGASGARRLFPSIIDEGARYFKAHGFIPAETGYVLNAALYEQHPWLAFNLYKAFLHAKEVYQQRLSGRGLPSGLIFAADYLRRTRQLFGNDPFPDGVRANRAMLDAALDAAADQGVTRGRPKLEDLVPPQLTDF